MRFGNPAQVEVPSGSRVPFFQAAAPLGWTQVVTQNDRMLRVVSGAGAGTGGTWTTTHSHTYTDVPNHVHSIDPPNTAAVVTDPGHRHRRFNTGAGVGGQSTWTAVANDAAFDTATVMETVTTGVTASVDILAFNSANPTGGVATGTTAAQSVNGDAAWRPAYIDVIVCSKN